MRAKHYLIFLIAYVALLSPISYDCRLSDKVDPDKVDPAIIPYLAGSTLADPSTILNSVRIWPYSIHRSFEIHCAKSTAIH